MKTENEIGMVRRTEGQMVRASEGRQVTFRASTTAKDRHGTRVVPAGIDTANFDKNPVFLWGHDGYGGWSTPAMENVLGRVVATRKDAGAFDIDVDFAEERVNPKAEMALRMVKAGILSAVSIGFIPRDIVVETEDSIETPIIQKCELLEVSLVSIPSNPEALALVRNMSMSLDIKSILDGFPEAESIRDAVVPAIRTALAAGIPTQEQWSRLLKDSVQKVQASLSTAPDAESADNAVVTGAAVRRAFIQWQVEDAFRRALNN